MSLLSYGSISLYGSGFSLAMVYPLIQGFPGSSDGKEFACNAGDPDSIPGSGRSLEKRMANYSSILAWRIPWAKEPGRLHP